ncbi:WecB/TagA/CpsF family glycosyltransferase [Rhodococcus jostii]|uniref:WecB/TagA/CpsF family glycosyltransferase n=1 Tax=Rhodococcus jostii TaxID=132919 RepID=UPI00364300F1
MKDDANSAMRSRLRNNLNVSDNGEVYYAKWKLDIASNSAVIARMSELRSGLGQHLVVTMNVDQLLDLAEGSALADAYDIASMRLIDGMPIVFLARLLGAKDVHRNTGADLLIQCSEVASKMGWKIAIAGGKSTTAEKATRNLSMRYPSAEIVSIDFPMMEGSQLPLFEQVAAELRAVAPDLVFLCLGAPKQERWFLEHRELLPDGVYIGAGAAVDFAAGDIARSPVWLQRIGFEWAHRLVTEPRRLWRRYLVRGPRFISVVLASLRKEER